MSSSLRVFLGVCLLALLLAGSMFLFRPDLADALVGMQGQGDGSQGEASASSLPSAVVAVAQPRRLLLPERIEADGEVVAWQEASVASESNALTLSEVLVNVGDTVRRGDVLARFSGRTVAAEVTQARAALAEAEAAAVEARANARRVHRLRGTDTLSAQQGEQYLSADRTAQARVRSARAALQAKQQSWQNVELRAPDDGVISSRTATVGAVPAAGTELFRLIRQGRLEWQAELGSDEVLRVKPGGTVTFLTADRTPVRGTVRARAPSEDTKKRTTLVYVDVPASPGLWAGQFAQGRFELGESEALTVSMEALVPADGFLYVYRLKEASGTGGLAMVERVRVRTGRQVDDRIEILPDGAVDRDGAGSRTGAHAGNTGAQTENTGSPDVMGKWPAALSARDQVVVSGAAFLSDGDLVKVADAPVRGSDQTIVSGAAQRHVHDEPAVTSGHEAAVGLNRPSGQEAQE